MRGVGGLGGLCGVVLFLCGVFAVFSLFFFVVLPDSFCSSGFFMQSGVEAFVLDGLCGS